MKIKIEEVHGDGVQTNSILTLIPEDDLDKYDLGRMSHMLPHKKTVISSTDVSAGTIVSFEIPWVQFMTMISKLLDAREQKLYDE